MDQFYKNLLYKDPIKATTTNHGYKSSMLSFLLLLQYQSKVIRIYYTNYIMEQLFPFSSWCIGILNGMNTDSRPLDNCTKGGVLLTTHLMITSYKIFKNEPKDISTFGVSIVSAFIVGSLYCTGHLIGKAIKHTIKDKIE